MIKDLTRDEKLVLKTLENFGKSIGEDSYRMINQVMDFSGRGLGLDYELTYWHDIDGRFKSGFGAVPYSSRLHEIIERLVGLNLVSRDSQNPIEIKYVGEQNGN